MDYHQNARLMIHQREQLARKVLAEGSTLKLAAASFKLRPRKILIYRFQSVTWTVQRRRCWDTTVKFCCK